MVRLEKHFDLTNRVALVTGGAGGLGFGMAQALADAGADIAILDIDQTRADTAADQIRASGNRVIGVAADVSDVAEIEQASAAVVQALGHVDILVCSAGISLRKPALETTADDFDHLMNVNVRGLFFCNQVIGRHMIAKKSGSIINISSQGAFSALDGRPVYCGSKAAVSQISKTLAVDWIGHGVRVNAIAPGLMVTPLMDAPFYREEGRIQRCLNRIPAGRLGSPDDLAGITIFLASDSSRYVVGQTIIVDGGWTIY